jgi:hypothetical protein
MAFRTEFVKTPGIETCRNYHLVQRLIQERIRSVLMGDPFVDQSQFLAAQFLEAPAAIISPDEMRKHFQQEGKEVLAAFHQYEKNPEYAESIRLLKQYEGKIFNITNTTMSGIMVVIDTEENEAVA